MGSLAVWVAVVVTVLGLVAVMAAAARRLLGVRFGRIRLLLAGVLALLVSGPISRGMAGSVPRETTSTAPLWLLILAVIASLIVAMVFLVIAEALVPTGRVTPLLWLRGLRARSRRARRYAQILTIAVRHGLGPYLRGRRSAAPAARSLRQALEEGGLTFVKLGQVLSTRRDLVPGGFVDELSTLRDRATPIAWTEVQAVLEAEFGVPPGELFASIEPEPLAAASVAQVHAATLRSGAPVVVKVQRPGIRSIVDRDLDIVGRLAATLETRTRWGRTAGAVGLADGFAQAVREELDFRIEARNLVAVAAADPDGPVTFPVPVSALCTEKVLVMSRLDGVPLSGAGPVVAARGLDAAELARTLLFCVLRQILVAGVFHADPHPGNVLLLTDGRLGLLDFGSVGRLDGGVREALQRLLLALDRGDPAGATDALLGVVARPDKVDEELTTLVPVLRRLPRRVDRIASALERGRLGVNVRLFADERDRRHVSALVHQVLLTVLGGVAGIMAVMLLGTPGGPMVTATLSLYALFGYHLLAVAAILALRVLVVIFRTGR